MLLDSRPPCLLGVWAEVEGSLLCWEVASSLPEKSMATTSSTPSPGSWQLVAGSCAGPAHPGTWVSPCRAPGGGSPAPYTHQPLTVKSEGPRRVQNVLREVGVCWPEARPLCPQPARRAFSQAPPTMGPSHQGRQEAQEGSAVSFIEVKWQSRQHLPQVRKLQGSVATVLQLDLSFIQTLTFSRWVVLNKLAQLCPFVTMGIRLPCVHMRVCVCDD